MPDFHFSADLLHPQRIAFGSGTLSVIRPWVEERGLKRILVVTDAFNATRLDRLGLTGRLTVFGRAKPDPEVPTLNELLGVAEAARPELVIGFGGGSVMDLAKLAAALAGSGQTLREVIGPDRLAGRRAALIQLPTTAGTGSEVSTRAFFTDPATPARLAVRSRHLLADLTVVDPDLTTTLSAALTATTGMTAMAHCAEALTNPKSNPVIDPYAFEGIHLIGRFLTRAVLDATDQEARAGLALAAMYGGFCLEASDASAVHALAHPLGARHGIAHGVASALLFPHILAFNASASPMRTKQVLEALGLPASNTPSAVLESSRGFCQGLGLAMYLSRLGVPESALPAMAAEAHASSNGLGNTPGTLSAERILAIYRAAY
jgi:alcohol dehydrogenase class IV